MPTNVRLYPHSSHSLGLCVRNNAYAAMHKMACFESAAIVSECEKMTQGGRTVCYWYTKYPPGSLSASTVGGRRVCSQLPSHSVCGHSTIVAWCVRVIQQSSSSSLQTTIVGPTKVAWCVPSLSISSRRTSRISPLDSCQISNHFQDLRSSQPGPLIDATDMYIRSSLQPTRVRKPIQRWSSNALFFSRPVL